MNYLNLDKKKTASTAKELNILLADYHLYYQKLRNFHWNIVGNHFFNLHIKFEEMYDDAKLKIDEIAERILTLGFTPLHSFSDYIKNSDVKETVGISDGVRAVETILHDFKILILKERELLKLSAEANDEGTGALMSDYIREQEKTVWMYNSFLGKKSS